jgi:hypothetical protein
MGGLRDKVATAGFGEAAYQRRNERRAARHQTTDEVIARYTAADGARPGREPLTTGQHILHLLLTVFTCGLWAPVWIIRAVQGNRPAKA